MNLKHLFRLKTADEKIADYRALKSRLEEVNQIGAELSDKFMIQKSIIDSSDTLPEEKRTEVFSKYEDFMKTHTREVSSLVNERTAILKSIEKMREDEELGETFKNIDALDVAKKAYLSGKIMKSRYFDIVKSITGEPVKYADVVAQDSMGRILILHRVEDFCPTGFVCIPGGHVDPGEDFETAALRELKEETNLDPVGDKGIRYLGEHKTEDAWIKYYGVTVDSSQPVTVDATEHCFFEYIDVGELALKPFIFNQGEIVFEKLMTPTKYESLKPLIKACKNNIIAPSVLNKAVENVLKAMDTEDAAPLMPESMDGDKKRIAVLPVRDPKRCVSQIMKAISGQTDVTVGSDLKFTKPLIVHETRYRGEPETNRLMEVEIVYSGEDTDMGHLLNEMKYGLMMGSLKVRTPHEEFMAVNENGTDYVGDPVFVDF